MYSWVFVSFVSNPKQPPAELHGMELKTVICSRDGAYEHTETTNDFSRYSCRIGLGDGFFEGGGEFAEAASYTGCGWRFIAADVKSVRYYGGSRYSGVLGYSLFVHLLLGRLVSESKVIFIFLISL